MPGSSRRAAPSARAYLDAFGEEEARVLDIDVRAHYIGAPSIRWFVRAVGGQP